VAALVWLAFVVFPLVNAVTDRGTVADHALAIAGAALFVAGYVGLIVVAFGDQRQRLGYGLCAALVVIALALTLADRAGWGFLFTYCAACTALVVPARYGFQAVAGLAVLALVATTAGGGGGGAGVGYGASAIGIGLLMVLMRDLRTRNRELSAARAELARHAVAQERERFARDLHDLLGHTLSVIALKAELARKLIPAQPGEAVREVGEVESVARQALGEVRLAVSGYRRPTLDGELAGARAALDAAGITTEVRRVEAELPAEAEAVLAWAVREGATNVIRHSGASRCTVRVIANGAQAGVEVVDDGVGRVNGSGPGGGNGLMGLRERAEAQAGSVEAGGLPGESGFRLAVRVPIAS
jgi:two-component system sensor histidine kinase DesK